MAGRASTARTRRTSSPVSRFRRTPGMSRRPTSPSPKRNGSRKWARRWTNFSTRSAADIPTPKSPQNGREPMATATEVTQTPDAQKTVQELRQLYADAPDIAKAGLENLIAKEMKARASRNSPRTVTAGRIGLRQGKVSELTMIVPFAKGGATRLRGLRSEE